MDPSIRSLKSILSILNNVGAIDENRGVTLEYLMVVLSMSREELTSIINNLIQLDYVSKKADDSELYYLTPRGVLAASSIYS